MHTCTVLFFCIGRIVCIQQFNRKTILREVCCSVNLWYRSLDFFCVNGPIWIYYETLLLLFEYILWMYVQMKETTQSDSNNAPRLKQPTVSQDASKHEIGLDECFNKSRKYQFVHTRTMLKYEVTLDSPSEATTASWNTASSIPRSKRQAIIMLSIVNDSFQNNCVTAVAFRPVLRCEVSHYHLRPHVDTTCMSSADTGSMVHRPWTQNRPKTRIPSPLSHWSWKWNLRACNEIQLSFVHVRQATRYTTIV